MDSLAHMPGGYRVPGTARSRPPHQAAPGWL